MLYHAYQTHRDLVWPIETSARAIGPLFDRAPPALKAHSPARELAAARALLELAQLTHCRPPFAIDAVTVGHRETKVSEETVLTTPFATLLRFRKAQVPEGEPRVLVVAPMSGHFATLLRETVRTMLPDHDVYVTDWHNARDVPLAAGQFGLDEYTEHVMRFVRALGPGAHVLAICQPCVAALAAVALMAEGDDPATPRSITLMAGPIDCRVSPTEVNRLATDKPIEWFETRLTSSVPLRYAGALRCVYPGFLQLMAFMSMNLERHVRSFEGYYQDLVNGDHEKAETTKSFYKEYFAVADLPAEFYLDTVRLVFQEYALPRGKLTWRGHRIDLAAIRRAALLTIEGERDDICALGQTLAAHDLCTGLRQYLKTHYVQPGAGHYGVFSGRRWNQSIYPIVRDVIRTSS
jgi:poly(3-hydroxybutyrate) depolymerase